MSNGLPSHKSSTMKIIAVCLGAFAILIIISALCVPMFFSTSVGKKMLVTMISNRAGIALEIDDLSLSWFGSQSAQGIRMQKPQQQLTLNCKEIITDASLWKLALKNDLGQLKIISPNLQMAGPFQSSVHLNKSPLRAAAFAAVPQVQLAMPAIRVPVTGRILVEEGKVSFNPPGLDPVRFDQLALSLDMTQKDELALALSCSTNQQTVEGQIAMKAAASQLSSSFPNFSVQSTITQLPVRGVDQLVSIFSPDLNGLIYAAIGATVDMQCNFNAAAGNFDLCLNAQSPQMTAQIATQTSGGMISLKNPATLNFNLTPALFARIGKISPSFASLILAQPALLQATLPEFSCPMPTQASDLLKSAFQATIAAPPQMLFSLNGKPLTVSGFKANASSALLEQQVVVNLTTSIQTPAQTGSIAIDGKIDNPFTGNLQGSLGINASKLPVDLIGLAAGGSSGLSTLLGPTADLIASLSFKEANPKLHLSWQSQFLSIPSLDISLINPFTLISPASFTLTLNPQLSNQLAKADPIQGTLNNLLIPTDNIKNSRINASVSTGQIALTGAIPLNILKLQASLSVSTLDQIALKIEGEPLKASLIGAFNPSTSEFTLTKPLLVQYNLDNAMFQALAPAGTQLVKPAVVQLSLDPVAIPLSNIDLSKMSLKGQLTSGELTLGVQGKQIALQNTSLPFQWDRKAKTAALELSSLVQNPSGDAGSMQGQIDLSNFMGEKGVNFNAASILVSFDLQNISTALLDAFSGKTILSAVIGPSFSSKLKLQSSLDKQNIAIKWTSPNLNVDSSFVMDKTAIQLQGAANQITWTLTPESYRILDKLITGPTNAMVPFEIKEPSTFTFSLSKLSLPTIAKKEIRTVADRIPDIVLDMGKLQLSATGRNPLLNFLDKSSKESIQLSNLSFSLNKSGEGSPLTGSFDSSVVTQTNSASPNPATKNGSLSLAGKLEQTFDNKGNFDLSKLTCGLQVKIQQLPARALDIVARAKGRTDMPFTTIFGDMINATFSMDLKNFNGPVAFNMNTPRARAELTGHLVSGALLLNDSISAQMKITPEMSRILLKEVNPLNLSYLYSQAPVTLEIPADGFYFPLYPFSMGKIAIPDATIELGKINCRNEGNVNITLGLLKTKQFDKSGELSLWFAPIDLSIKKGLVDIDRTEILLADTFDVCLWGNFDLLKNYVDMTLGLTAQTLAKAFGIKNLPENYVLTIPMKGPADNVQINTGKATTKVALLLAWQNKNVAGALGGGPAGALVGEFLGKMATLPDSDAKVPPAKHPFPWEIGKGSKTSHTSHEKKREFKPNEKPLKQILKVIR